MTTEVSNVYTTPYITIRLDGAPMGKERVRFSRASGRTFTPERTVAYEGRLALAAQQAMNGRPLLEGPLAVDIVANMPIAESWPKKRRAAALAGTERPTKKPDADNVAKMLDALNLVVWPDDGQVVDLRVQKFYSAAPSLTVRVRQIGSNDGNGNVHSSGIAQRVPTVRDGVVRNGVAVQKTRLSAEQDVFG